VEEEDDVWMMDDTDEGVAVDECGLDAGEDGLLIVSSAGTFKIGDDGDDEDDVDVDVPANDNNSFARW